MSLTEHMTQKMTGEEKQKLDEGERILRPGASWLYDAAGGKPVRRPNG
jgi:hypothetical protein